MKKYLVLALLFLTTTVRAQQLEQVQTIVWLNFLCNGSQTASGGNQILYLENYVDQLLPNPTYLTSVIVWNELGPTAELPASVTGNVTVGIDPGKKYITESGFPAVQTISPQFLKTIVVWELFPHGPNQSEMKFSPPIAYRPGQDAIVFAPECVFPSLPLFFSLNVRFQNVGDLSSLPLPIVTYNITNDVGSPNNPPTYFRNLVPAQAGTKIRVRADSKPNGMPASTASHVSVCIQSGTGPNCVAPPVELKFNNLSGFSLIIGERLWSDWTPFTVSAGQNLLVIESFSGNANSFAYNPSAPNGVWVSSVEGWNLVAMPGPITFVPNRMFGIDGVQQQ